MQTQKLIGIAAAGIADAAAVEKAFETLKTYDWGADRAPLVPLERAVVAALRDAKARAALEARLAAVLETDAPRDAKDVVCRHLRVLGDRRVRADVGPTLDG